MENLISQYERLLKAVQEKHNEFTEDKMSVFNFAKGSSYDNQFLIIGRAVNGWNSFDKQQLEENASEVIEYLNHSIEGKKEYDLQWVIDKWGKENQTEDTDNYNTKKSAFWRLSKMIADHHFPEANDNINFLAWTNLYKVSKAESGNPSVKLQNVQFEICKEILFAEIDLLKPKFAIFLTGWDWARWFLEGNKNVALTEKPQNASVKHVGMIGKTFFVVAEHPQGKPEDAQMHEILAEIERHTAIQTDF